MNELALFAGAGGGILGGKLLGWRTVCAVEINAYCRSVLLARQRDGHLEPFPIWDDVTTFDGHPWRGRVDVVSGGFPCQDISAAGRGAGIRGERSGLWAEFARIIGEVQPQYVFVENVAALLGRGIDAVLGDLAALGYDARWGVVSAADAGAPHLRERIWIMAYASGTGRQSSEHNRASNGRQPCRPVGESGQDGGVEVMGNSNIEGLEGTYDNPKSPERIYNMPSESGSPVPDSERERQQGSREQDDTGNPEADREGQADFAIGQRVGYFWAVEPDVGRVANGVARRVDRLSAIGNGQVPEVVALAWNTLRESD